MTKELLKRIVNMINEQKDPANIVLIGDNSMVYQTKSHNALIWDWDNEVFFYIRPDSTNNQYDPRNQFNLVIVPFDHIQYAYVQDTSNAVKDYINKLGLNPDNIANERIKELLESSKYERSYGSGYQKYESTYSSYGNQELPCGVYKGSLDDVLKGR